MIIPPGFGQATIVFKHADLVRPAQCVFGVENLTGLTNPGTLADLVLQEFFSGASNAGDQVDSQVTITTKFALGQDGGPPTLGESSTSTAGGQSLTSQSPAVSLLVKKRTALGGRENRGRMFVPWSVAETSVSEVGAVVSPAPLTTLQAAYNAFLIALSVVDLPMVILHNSVTVPTTVTGLVVDPLVATQRRRQR